MVLNEPYFFYLMNTVDTRSLSSLSHLMMTPFCKSLSISTFMIWETCNVWSFHKVNFKTILNNNV